jgi:hypothetical protein
MIGEPVYPNPEHRVADRTARRRAETALIAIAAEVETLRRRLRQADNPLSSLDGDDVQVLTSKVQDLTVEFSHIGLLRDVREWAAADRAQAARGADAAYERWIAGEAGPAYAGDTDVKDGFLDGYQAALGGPGEA